MECRSLDINIKKASGLKNVNLFTTMDVYAVVSISGESRWKSKQHTPVAKHSGSDPHWNHPMKFTINDAAAESNRLNLKIKFVSNRSLGNRKIGTVIVPIKQLIDEGKSERSVHFTVRTSRGEEKGMVEISYKFGKKYTVQAPPPVNAYPAPSHGYGYAYDGHPPPPQVGYVYGGYPPPAHPGYGFPAMQQPYRPKKNGVGGMALGAGAGLLGGLMIGDMISDIGDGFDF